MKNIKIVALIGIVAMLVLSVSGAGAQGPAPGDETNAIVAAAISYQGRLTDAAGMPLSGTYDLEFTFWSLESGGVQLGAADTRLAQVITNGLYSAPLKVPLSYVDGRELWLRIRVRETGAGTWETLTPRVQVIPTAYALSLRPGAQIEGSEDAPDAIIMATNTSSGWGLRGESTEPTGYGVYGYNGSTSASAYGGGVLGRTMTDGYGVRGEAPSSGDFGYGGYFTGRTGVRGFGTGTNYLYDYGGYFLAERRGIYAASAGAWYAGYFNGDIYVNGTVYPMSATRMLVVNGGAEPLEPGDVVAIGGVAAPLEDGGAPVLAVRKASGVTDKAIVGVVAEAMHVQRVKRPEDPPGQTSIDIQPAEGSISPGGCLAIVTHGLVPAVKVSASKAEEGLGIGDLVGPAAVPGRIQRTEAQVSSGTILGKVAGPYDPKTGTVPVFVTLQ